MTIKEFAQILEEQQKQGLIHQGYNPENHNFKVFVKPGTKYTKIDVGRSGKYMVVNSTGEIYGIKAYGVIHKGHKFGTLNTVHEYNWSGYRAIKIA